MGTYLLDVTISTAEMPPDVVVRGRAALEARRNTGDHVESWVADGVEYWRVVRTVEAPTIRVAIEQYGRYLQEKAAQYGMDPEAQVVVQVAIRDVRFHVFDTLPPAARRAARGGRPPKNPPTGA